MIESDITASAQCLLDDERLKHLSDKKTSTRERIVALGVPSEEITESVSLVVSALNEKIDDMQLEIEHLRAQLEEMQTLVDVDCLAPIPNRRAFMKRLHWVISMQERYDEVSSIVYFDLTRFKHINDTYGHAAGDEAIRHVVSILNSMKRDTDFMARLGGDEFAIIMYYADETIAQRRAEQIAEKICTTPFLFDGYSLQVGTAYGYHTIQKGQSAEEALHAADHSMYENKMKASA